jgi:hypothetical protein
MRELVRVTFLGAVFLIMSWPFSAGADISTDCVPGCVVPIQYPYQNSPYMTPEQQYQERQREYREQKNDEYYQNERLQRELEQNRERSRTTYGAIAYSPDDGNYGYSQNYGSRAQAESRARQQCGKSDCEIAAWFYNSCGALAADEEEGSWGGAQGSSEQRASAGAQARCASEGGKNCKVLVSVCSR